MMNMVEWRKIIIFHHVCYWIDAYLEGLFELEFLKLKSEIKDLLLVAFRRNKPLQPKALHV